MTANLYSIPDPDLLHETVGKDAKHFEGKHGVIPTEIRIHPRYVAGVTEIAGLKVVPDARITGYEYVLTDGEP